MKAMKALRKIGRKKKKTVQTFAPQDITRTPPGDEGGNENPQQRGDALWNPLPGDDAEAEQEPARFRQSPIEDKRHQSDETPKAGEGTAESGDKEEEEKGMGQQENGGASGTQVVLLEQPPDTQPTRERASLSPPVSNPRPVDTGCSSSSWLSYRLYHLTPMHFFGHVFLSAVCE